MKCPSCNAELPPSAKFCGACGATLAAPPSEPSWAPPAQQGEQGQSWPPPAPEQAWGAIPPPEQQWNPPSPGQPPSYGAPAVAYPGHLPPVEKRFKALRMMAMLLKVLAFVVAGICVILALVAVAGGAATSTTASSSGADFGPAAFFSGFVGALFMLIYGGFMFIFLYAYAEVIYLFLSIEENTRVTNEVLRTR